MVASLEEKLLMGLSLTGRNQQVATLHASLCAQAPRAAWWEGARRHLRDAAPLKLEQSASTALAAGRSV